MQFRLVLTAKDQTLYERGRVRVAGQRCPIWAPCPLLDAGSADEIDYDTVPTQDWSLLFGTLEDGDNVVIERGTSVIFNVIGPSPIYREIRILGRLSFGPANGDGIGPHLRAHHIFVEGGEFLIGQPPKGDQPAVAYIGKATITLHGNKEESYLAFDRSIEAGNKVLANAGFMYFHGEERHIQTRLHAPCKEGQGTIKLATDIVLREGDKLTIGDSSYAGDQTEEVELGSYDQGLEVWNLVGTCKYFHFGAEIAPENDYDYRAEVALLTRSVLITQHQEENLSEWGCQVLTSSYYTALDYTIRRIGTTQFNNVEIAGCSQKDTLKAAVRFEQAGDKTNPLKESKLIGCSIHSGLGHGLRIDLSHYVTIVETIVFNFRSTGINILTSSHITLDGNWVQQIGVNPELVKASSDWLNDKMAGIAICTFIKRDTCTKIKVVNNIVMSAQWAGFQALGQNCPIELTEVIEPNVIF